MKTVFELREHADAQLLSGAYDRALHAYAALIQLQPNDLDARLRVADTLLALGEPQAAATVYAALARHAAHAGHPLHALVALKILEKLEPELSKLLDSVAELYCRESPRLGRASRLSLGETALVLPPELRLDTPPPLEELVPAAAQIALNTERIAAYPEKLPPIPLFSELPREAFARLLREMDLIRTQPGQEILREGAPGTSFFVVGRGVVQILKSVEGSAPFELAKLRDGAIFGEMALVSARPRSASVIALRDSDLLEFDADALRAAASEVETIGQALVRFSQERLLQNLMNTSPLFRPLEARQRRDLLQHFSAHEIGPGTSIIREGEEGRGLFVVLSGEVEVLKGEGEERVALAQLGPGSVIGEIALLHARPTTATVKALESSTLLFLSREKFSRLVEAVDAIRDYVESLGDERLMDTNLALTTGEYEDFGDDIPIAI